MLTNHLHLLSFFAITGEAIPKSKIQKMAYIAKQMGMPLNERYHFHRNGPYSEALTVRIEELCNLHFLEEKREKGSVTYHLTTQGQTFLDQFHFSPNAFESLCQRLNHCSNVSLEIMSSILYFEQRDGHAGNFIERARSIYEERELTDAMNSLEKQRNVGLFN
ncbi:uncharacterized protein YwgA [Alkalihalobacillus xiaoxiensis]|uniref:Uncharacterized protein YwgA n=1 Tax=Shouchella xiaoxiensis TaxID=766895 RepID=A0ABS2SYM1_9BACI|nr:YwgA family protein [Shouchella xiaoxiensis]MBM7840599.1 uncharacterized protein YwgA [Shouchella xiaoxiensis]